MSGVASDETWLTRWASEPFMYLTTVGRRTGKSHRIEIWFAVHEGRLYLRAGGGERADWVRNLRANPGVTVELGDETHAGTAHLVAVDTAEDELARGLLVGKYEKSDGDLTEWGRTSLPVRIEFPSSGG